jgi:sugar lactone lactonase YvrE
MFRFDKVLVAPSREDLERTLLAAATAANKGCRSRKLTWTTTTTDTLLSKRSAAPEGFQQWNGEDERKQRGQGGDTRSAVAVVWWTDRLGRTHYRIAADRIGCRASYHVKNLICPYRERPPLWLLYPEDLYLRPEGEQQTLFAACRCGATGTPESLGWMGPYCAACHDRNEAGERPVLLPGCPAHRALADGHRWLGGVMFTPDGRGLVSHERCGGKVRIWDLATGQARGPELSGGSSLTAVSPDGETAATGAVRGQVVLWSLSDGRKRQTFEVDTGPIPGEILALAFSPDGSLLAVQPYGQVQLWDVASGRMLSQVARGLRSCNPSRLLAFSPDGATLAVAPQGEELRLWDVAKGQARSVAIPKNFADVVAFSPDGRTLGLGGNLGGLGSACLLDVKRGRVRVSLKMEQSAARDLAFSPDGKTVALASHDGSVWLYTVTDGRCLGGHVWHTSEVNSVAFSPDGQWLATASDDAYVKLWPVSSLWPA